LTYFRKQIVIVHIYVKSINGNKIYYIYDENNIIYNVDLFYFGNKYVLENMNENTIWDIEGFGYYIPILNIYYNITNIYNIMNRDLIIKKN